VTPRLRALPVRTADADLLDAFLVSAVATVLLIRIFLEATGYPRLGGNGLHIAHVLWGGLGMLVAIVLLLLFLSSGTRLAAAIVGGAGFGAFIDELGKFVTADNDYFFKPTAAIVYAVFVILFLVTRQVRVFRALTPRESLVNAVALAEKLALHQLAAGDRDRALELLARSDRTDPLVATLRERFLAADVVPLGPSRLRRAGARAQLVYARVAATVWFHRFVAGVFVLQGIGFVLTVLAALALIGGALFGVAEARAALDESTGGSTISSWVQVLAGLIAGALVISGVVALRSSRVRAYRSFELAVLVDLLLAQPFAFLEAGFAAAFGVLVDVVMLAVLRYLQVLERGLWANRAAHESPHEVMRSMRSAITDSNS
jgi:hypothetical protein